MITYKDIQNANAGIAKIDIKGKKYSVVAAKVAAFRQICPAGSIQTQLVSLEDGVVTMVTTVSDEEGHILATGFAQEKESSSFINKTSFIENCETSAVGRALAFLGIGSDEQIASAEEVQNAMLQQEEQKTISDKEKLILKGMVTGKGYTVEEIFPKGLDLTAKQYVEACRKLAEIKPKGGKA